MDETMVLMRRLGQVQRRVTNTVQVMSERIVRLEREVMRLRAQCVLARTAALWGLTGWMQPGGDRGPAMRRQPLRVPPTPTPSTWPEADQVLCQTGCVSHAHHWLDAQGQCRRDGEPCERLQAEGVRHVPAA